MKIKNKIIAAILALVMLVCAIPLSVFATDTDTEDGIVLESVSIAIGEDIAINYYLNIGDEDVNALFATFTYGEKTKTVALRDEEKSGNVVKLSIGLNTLEMAEDVVLTLAYSDGEAVSFTTATQDTPVTEYTYSVKQYVESILARKTSSDELRAAVRSLLAYG